MWFKNLQVYRFTNAIDLDTEALSEQLEQHAFKPCNSQELNSAGWTPPLGQHGTDFVHAASGYIMVCNKRQDKLLPAAVINEALDERIQELETAQDRKISRKERRDLKEEITFSLLPRAFVRSSLQFAYISTREKLLIVNASSEKRADELVSQLRQAIGSLPVAPLTCKQQPLSAMTQWVKTGKLSNGLALGGECELRSDNDITQIICCKNQDLSSAEILNHLKTGMHVSKLELSWDERIEFILDEKLVIKRVRFTDVVQEKVEQNEQRNDDAASAFDVDFSIMTLELSAFLQALTDALGGEDERKEDPNTDPAESVADASGYESTTQSVAETTDETEAEPA
ncbi:MAG: recombination-associated protein RdgC [Granulosicoccus sp.]|nr:recombination-associated protein RdgC [Granulosicoccus sp.]